MVRIFCGRPLILLLLLFLIPVEALAQVNKAMFPYDAPVVDKEDRSTSLETLRNHPIVVVAYVASMPDCRKGIERFVTLSDSFKKMDVKFLSVDVSPMEAKKFPAAIPANTGNVLFMKDIKGRIRSALKVGLIPTTFFVSRDGEIIGKVEASHSWDTDDFRSRVKSFTTHERQ
jgi:peroxiredoxin